MDTRMESSKLQRLDVGLMGFEFASPNKGCEALSYSFVDFLSHELKNNVKIHVWEDTQLGQLPRLYPNISFNYISPKLRNIKFSWIRAIMKCDYVFDITMGDSFSDIYSKKYCSGLIRRKRIAEIFNKKYILMPQTYGPFYDERIRKNAIKVINKAYKVMARERLSIEYLKNLKVTREIKEHIDLAFMLPFDKSKYAFDRSKKNIGINVSGLLWKGGFNRPNQFNLTMNYKQYIKSILTYYTHTDEWRVHLIPHVIDVNENAHDDDYKVLEELQAEFSASVLAPAFDDPISAKSYISNLDCFIGARMHSTIAAFSSGVPVIPVSYSRKFEGVFDSLKYKYLIHGNKYSTDDAIQKTLEYVDNYETLRKNIESDYTFVSKKVNALKNELRTILNQV